MSEADQSANSKCSTESSADEFPVFDPNSSVSPASQAPDPLIGAILGPYKILQELGKGGMGTVYVAEQDKPIRRRVALKVIKEKSESEQVMRRFEAERQALAMMSHENIAKVLDAGEDGGRPYFVMELVKGIPITEYCDVNRLSIAERLQLFIPVCKAVHHAHQKGIIHRDLKPTNILVEEVEGKPAPKVIDFGLAKALNTQAKLTDQSFFTEFGRVVGTVHYMSPEQAEMNQLDVDTRADVYSLGVILYELLTGSRPLDDDTIRKNVFLKVLELIREQEPEKPSSRVSDSKSADVDFEKRRRISSGKLEQVLRGDLDWIVMKSLEKDRTRRYASASDFGQDVQNYLDGELVSARKPTLAYRASKFARKNFGLVISSAAIAAAILIGLLISSQLAYNLSIAVEEKSEALDAAESQKREAEKQTSIVVAQKTELELRSAKLRDEMEKSVVLAESLDETNKQLQQYLLKMSTVFEETKLQGIATLILLEANNLFGVSIAHEKETEAKLVVKQQSSRRLWQHQLALAPSGRRMASADLVTGKIRLWDTQSKEMLQSWDGHEMPATRGGSWATVSSLAFDNWDENILFSSGLDGKVIRWDLSGNVPMAEFTLDDGQPTSIRLYLHSSQPSLLVGTDKGELIQLDRESLQELARIKLSDQRIHELAVSSNGQVVAACQAGVLCVIDSGLKNVKQIEVGDRDFDLLCTTFSPDGKQIATGDTQGQISIYDSSTLQQEKQFVAHHRGSEAEDDKQNVRTLAWAASGKLYSGGSDGLIHQWNATFELENSLKGHAANYFGRSDVMALAVSGDECYSIGRDHSMRAWDLKSGRCTHSLQGHLFPHQVGHTSDYTRFSYHPDSQKLLVAADSNDAYARLLDTRQLQEVALYREFPLPRYIEENGGAQTQDICFANDGRRFAVAEPTGQISVWAIDGKKPIKTFAAHPIRISGNPRLPHFRIAWAENDKELISIGNDQQLKVWDSETFELLQEWSLADGSADGSADEEFRLLPQQLLGEYLAAAGRIEFDHQLLLRDQQIITAGRDEFIRVWDSATHKIVAKFRANGTITCASLSADQSFLAAGTVTGEVVVIQLDSGTTIASRNLDFYTTDQFAFGSRQPTAISNPYGDHKHNEWNRSVRGIAFAPNNRILAVSTGNGVLSLLTISGELLHRAMNYETFDFSWRQQLPFFTASGQLFTVGADRVIREWELDHVAAKPLGSMDQVVTTFVTSADSERIIQIGVPELADEFVWVKSDDAWIAHRLPEDFRDATSAAFIPRSTDILIGTRNGRAIRYDYLNNKIVCEFRGPKQNREFTAPVGIFADGARVACSFNGGLAASSWSEKEKHVVDIWDLESGEWKSTIRTARGVEALTFHPTNKELAITDESGKIQLYDVERESEPFEIFHKSGPQFPRGLRITPDGELLIQAGELYSNRLISVWDAKTGGEVDPTTGLVEDSMYITRQDRSLFQSEFVTVGPNKQSAGYRDLAISPNGRWMITAGKDGYLVLWEIDGRKLQMKYQVSTPTLSSLTGAVENPIQEPDGSLATFGLENVEFSADGETVYFSDKSGPIRLLKLAEILRLAERTPREKRDDYSRSIGLEMESSGRARTIEKNRLIPVFND